MKLDPELIDYLWACGAVLILWAAGMAAIIKGGYGVPLLWGMG